MILKIYNLLASNIVLIIYKVYKLFRFCNKGRSEFEILVVSKDRPLSLFSFLKSVETKLKDAPPIKIIISCSRQSDLVRYRKIEEEFTSKGEIAFMFEEKGFKRALIECLNNVSATSVMFCVDDQILLRELDYTNIVEEKRKVDFFTLRLGQDTKYSYNLNKFYELPVDVKISDTSMYWRSKILRDDFHYGLSLDTTIIDKKILVLMSKFLKFHTPNQFESFMNYSYPVAALLRYKIGCFRCQGAINFVLNKVQIDNNNRSLNYSLDELNNLYDLGLVIDLDPNAEFKSSHSDVGFMFRKTQ